MLNGNKLVLQSATGCSIRVETLGNFEGKSGLPRQNRSTLEKLPRKKIRSTEAEFRILEKYRGKTESTEAEFKYPRKITEAEFWLMLHPEC